MISILTPTYNRGSILKDLYNSLQSQSFKKFEWIIIDDGSEDDTEEIVRTWKESERDFKIQYYKTTNGGKHRAINFGVNYAIYEYVFIVDSDDYLLNYSVEKISRWINSLPKDNSFAGVSGLKGFKNKSIVGGYPLERKYKEFVDATNLERKKYNLTGDKAEVYRKEILKKYPFPEFENENFITEASVWDAIALDGYKIRWFNELIYICEYREDGLTNLGVQKEVLNFNGFVYYTKLRLKAEKGFYRLTPLCIFSNVARLKKISVVKMADTLEVDIFSMVVANSIDTIYRIVKQIKKNINKQKKMERV